MKTPGRLRHSLPYAWANLAVSFWIHVFKKLLPGRGRRGSALFLREYAPDRVVNLAPEELAALPALEACLSCSLCDAACPEIGAGGFTGPADFMRSLSRDPTYFALVEPPACGDCRACEPLCPSRIPIRAAVRYVEDKRRALETLGPKK